MGLTFRFVLVKLVLNPYNFVLIIWFVMVLSLHLQQKSKLKDMTTIKITNKEYSQVIRILFSNEETRGIARKIMRTKKTTSR